MAQVLTDTQPISTQDSKKQRKKQAKREARLMLKVEQAQKEVQKAERKVTKAQSNAERKVTKAQSNLEASKGQLQKFEEKLTEMRSAKDSKDSQNGSSATPVDAEAISTDEQPQAIESQENHTEAANEWYAQPTTEGEQVNTTADEAAPTTEQES